MFSFKHFLSPLYSALIKGPNACSHNLWTPKSDHWTMRTDGTSLIVIIVLAFNCICNARRKHDALLYRCIVVTFYLFCLAWKHHYFPEGFYWHLAWKCWVRGGEGAPGKTNKYVEGGSGAIERGGLVMGAVWRGCLWKGMPNVRYELHSKRRCECQGAMDSCRAISWSLARHQCAEAAPVTSVTYVSVTEPRANVKM